MDLIFFGQKLGNLLAASILISIIDVCIAELLPSVNIFVYHYSTIASATSKLQILKISEDYFCLIRRGIVSTLVPRYNHLKETATRACFRCIFHARL